MFLDTLLYDPESYWRGFGLNLRQVNFKTLGVLGVIIAVVVGIIILMVIFKKAKQRDNYKNVIDTTLSMDEHKNVMSDISSSTGVDPDAVDWAEAKNEIPTKTSPLETGCDSNHKQCISY